MLPGTEGRAFYLLDNLSTKFYKEKIFTIKSGAALERAAREGRESPVFQNTFSEPWVRQEAVTALYTYAPQTVPSAHCSRCSL